MDLRDLDSHPVEITDEEERAQYLPPHNFHLPKQYGAWEFLQLMVGLALLCLFGTAVVAFGMEYLGMA
jgi:hypothetical protein